MTKTELQIDFTQFDKVVEKLVQTDKRTFPQFINGQLMAVAREAMKSQKPANRNEIAKQMGVIRQKEVKRRGKKWVRISGREFGSTSQLENSFAARIVNAARIKAGMKPIFGEAMREPAQSLVSRKTRSSGFLKQGWIEALRSISQAYYRRSSGSGKTYPRGYSKPATFSFGEISGEIGNTVMGYRRKGGSNFPAPLNRTGRAWQGNITSPAKRLTEALQKAVNAVTVDMERKLVERLSRDWKALK